MPRETCSAAAATAAATAAGDCDYVGDDEHAAAAVSLMLRKEDSHDAAFNAASYTTFNPAIKANPGLHTP